MCGYESREAADPAEVQAGCELPSVGAQPATAL